MSDITVHTFERAVSRYFEPIAREHDWPLIRSSEDVFEISSPHFVMRIRFGDGWHSKNIDATVAPTASHPESPVGELGVFGIAGYNGVQMQILPREQSEDGFLEYAQYVANMGRTFGLPYLLGQKSDWHKVGEYWREESEKEIAKIRGYKFPSFVQKRWHLPPPPMEAPEKK